MGAEKTKTGAVHALALACLGAACLLPAACTTYYHPMSALHRPVAINTDYANFAGLELEIHCLPGPVLDEDEAADLCQKLSRLFENQGAVVQTRTTLGRVANEDGELSGARPTAGEGRATARTSLGLRLSSRLLHEESSWVFPWVTTEYTFAQDVVIRDETGFLLVKDSLTARLVRRVGLFGDAGEELTRDLYGQLSQLTLNARMRRRVLRAGLEGPGR